MWGKSFLYSVVNSFTHIFTNTQETYTLLSYCTIDLTLLLAN